MLDRDQSMKFVEEAYKARIDGEKDVLAQYWAADADFELVGDSSLLPGVTLHAADAMGAIGDLIDRFHFSDLKRMHAVVEGGNIAVRWAVTIKVDGKPPVQSQLLDLITLNEEGKIASFVQFADTALIRSLVS